MRRLSRPGAERYLAEALAMIDRAGGSHGVNLRELSRRLGCAHTNAYNYFTDLDDLLARALVRALEQQHDAARRALDGTTGTPLKRLTSLIDGQIAFAFAHRGLYRFCWLEPLRGPPLPRAIEVMEAAGASLSELVGEIVGGSTSVERRRALAEDLHTWLHGALAKALTGRVGPGAPNALRDQLAAAARRMCRQLLRPEGRG